MRLCPSRSSRRLGASPRDSGNCDIILLFAYNVCKFVKTQHASGRDSSLLFEMDSVFKFTNPAIVSGKVLKRLTSRDKCCREVSREIKRGRDTILLFAILIICRFSNSTKDLGRVSMLLSLRVITFNCLKLSKISGRLVNLFASRCNSVRF